MCTEYCLYLNNFCLQHLIKNQWIPNVKAVIDLILEQGSGLNERNKKQLNSLRERAPEIWTEDEAAFSSKIFEFLDFEISSILEIESEIDKNFFI